MSLSTTANAPNVSLGTQSQNYLPTMPNPLTGAGITFTTTNSPPTGYSYINNGTVQNLYLIEMQEMGSQNYIPFLATNWGLWVETDIQTYGALFTTTDPNKTAGGGAVLIGHGFTSPSTPPCISTTDSSLSIPVVSSLPTGVPSGYAGELVNYNSVLYIYNGSSWVPVTTNFSGNYDTLFLLTANSPMTIGNLNAGNVGAVSLTLENGGNDDVVLTAGYNSSPANNYIIPKQANFTGLGTYNFPFAWLDATSVSCNNVVPSGGDNTGSVGVSTAMWQNMYTRNLIVGNYSVQEYLTFSIDSTGLNLIMTSSSSSGSIIPMQNKTLNLGSSSNPWSSIYCLGINFMNSGLTANSGFNYWTSTQVGEFTPSHGIASSGDLYTPTNLWCAGSVIFNPSSGANAYLIWVNNGVLGLLSDANVGVGSYTHNSHTYYLGALDAGAVYVNYVQPLNMNGVEITSGNGTNGFINLAFGSSTCSLQINGSAGSSGQVLTSQGTNANPIWQSITWSQITGANTSIAQYYEWTSITNTNTDGVLLNYNTGTQKTNGNWSAFQVFDGLTTQILGLTYTGTLGAVDVDPLGGNNTGGVGGGSSAWEGVVCHTLYYDTQSQGSYDEYDDLAIVKGIKSKTVTVNGKTKQIINPDSLSLLRPEIDPQHHILSDPNMVNYYDVGKIHGFTFGCLKRIALKLDEHEASFEELAKLQAEVNDLRSQIQVLKGKNTS